MMKKTRRRDQTIRIPITRTSLAVQWLRLCASTAGGTGSTSGWGTKIPHATQSGQKKKKKKNPHHPVAERHCPSEDVISYHPWDILAGIYNLNLIMRKQQTISNWGTFCKITGLPSSNISMSRKIKTDWGKHFILKETKETWHAVCDPGSWGRRRRRSLCRMLFFFFFTHTHCILFLQEINRLTPSIVHGWPQQKQQWLQSPNVKHTHTMS